MISFSVAFDPNKGIGIRGALPWHLKDELKIFKRNTLYKNILMGQTTYDGLPRKLADRYITVASIDPSHIILSFNYDLDQAIGCRNSSSSCIVRRFMVVNHTTFTDNKKVQLSNYS